MSSPVRRLTLNPAFATLLRSCITLSQTSLRTQVLKLLRCHYLCNKDVGRGGGGGGERRGRGEISSKVGAASALMLVASCS